MRSSRRPCGTCPSSICGPSRSSRPARATRPRPRSAPRLSRFLHPRWWPTWIGLGFMRAVSWLPLPLIAFVGGALGQLLYILHAKRRHIVNVNVRRCFPELSAPEQARIARRHFRAFGQTLLDIGISWWASEARIWRLTRFRGREHYDKALRENKNIILLAPHFLGLEVGGIRLSIQRQMVTLFVHPVHG